MSLSENLPEDVIVHEEIFDVNPEVSLEGKTFLNCLHSRVNS